MIAPMFAAIAGVLLVALFPTAEERRRWRARRCAMPSARSRALLPGGALVAPFTIGGEPMGTGATIGHHNRPEENNE
jgi:hypothetical protein